MTRIRLEFEKGGAFTARLLETEAPRTCEIIRQRLPLSYRFHHSIVSGQALVTLPSDLTVPRENQRVAGTPPGALAFLVRDEPVLVPDEIYIAHYGLFISRGLTVDAKQPVNIFGQVEDRLDALAQVGRRVLMSGAELVQLSLIGVGSGRDDGADALGTTQRADGGIVLADRVIFWVHDEAESSGLSQTYKAG